MADAGQWKILKETVEKGVPGATVTSTYRPGSTGSNGGADYHSKGQAVDVHGDLPKIFEWLLQNFPGSEEIIYTPGGNRQIKNGQPHKYSGSVAAGHYDHVHWAATDLNAASHGQTPQPAGAGGGGASDPFGMFDDFLTNSGLWARVGAALAGVLLLLLALARLGLDVGLKELGVDKLLKPVTKAVKR